MNMRNFISFGLLLFCQSIMYAQVNPNVNGMQLSLPTHSNCPGFGTGNNYNIAYVNKPFTTAYYNIISGKFSTGPAKVDSIAIILSARSTIEYKCGPCGDTMTGNGCLTTSSAMFLTDNNGAFLEFNNGWPNIATAPAPSNRIVLNMGGSKLLTTSVNHLKILLKTSVLPPKLVPKCYEYIKVKYILVVYYANGCKTDRQFEYWAKRP